MTPVQEGRNIHPGQHEQFHWLTVTGDFYLRNLLSACPEIVMGRFVAIAARDSGTLTPEPGFDAKTGWRFDGDIAYSPRVEAPLALPHQHDGLEFPGFDEWFIFSDPPPNLGQIFEGNPFETFRPGPGSVLRFVGMLHFWLDNLDPLFALHFDWFWKQITWINPIAYVSDGADCLTFVSQDKELFERVRKAILAVAEGESRQTGFPAEIDYRPRQS